MRSLSMVLVVVTLGLVVGYTNCTKFQANLGGSVSGSFSSSAGGLGGVNNTVQTDQLPYTPPNSITSSRVWYVRADGGTRYSANNTSGQCDGLADTAYPGSGVNQHCAYNDFRFLYDDQHSYGALNWAISGGDTVIVDNSKPWRIGFDTDGITGTEPWCPGWGGGPYGCSNPPIPAGTAKQHTRILGRNFATCSVGNNPDKSKMSEVFGGHAVGAVLNLSGTQFVDVQCINITSHGNCVVHGSPIYPYDCHAGTALAEFSSDGITTDTSTSDVALQDLWIHGQTDRGIIGPIGGLVQANRVDIDTNGMAGWDFDPGNGTASINAQLYFFNSIIEWSGCNQEYPYVHALPIESCYSQSSGGYGDGIGTPNTPMTMQVFINNAIFRYNTQDGEDFGHVQTAPSQLVIKNSQSYGNSGGAFKWGPGFDNVTLENNIAIANCQRMAGPMPGTPSTYNKYLADFCRSGDALSFNFYNKAHALFANNTIISYAPTTFDMKCLDPQNCDSTIFELKNNVVRAYSDSAYDYNGNGAPGDYCGANCNDSTLLIGTINRDHNVYYGLRSCPAGKPVGATNGVISNESCVDPTFISEPTKFVDESTLDNYNINILPGSPLKAAGVTIPGLINNFFGQPYTNPPNIGAM